MGVFTNIQNALDTRLSELNGLPSVAWPNTKFAPALNTSFIRPTVLPADSVLSTLNAHKNNSGIYQIDIFVPLNKGVLTALEYADNIKLHFEGDRRLSKNNDIIFIKEISIRQAERDEAYHHMYIQINYECFSE